MLYVLHPRLPLWLQVPAAVLALGAVLAMREPPGAAAAPRSHARHVARVLRFSLVDNGRLATAIWLGVALSLASFMMVWLIQPYMQKARVPEPWFGPVWAAANLWVALMSLASHRVAGRLGVPGSLLLCCGLVGLGYALLAATTAWWGFAFYFIIMTFRGIQFPMLTAEVQKEAPDGDRASVLSLKNLLFRLSFVAVGPAFGSYLDRFGMRSGLAVLAAGLTTLSLAAFAAFVRARRRPRARSPASC
jgi:hypothetical protein